MSLARRRVLTIIIGVVALWNAASFRSTVCGTGLIDAGICASTDGAAGAPAETVAAVPAETDAAAPVNISDKIPEEISGGVAVETAAPVAPKARGSPAQRAATLLSCLGDGTIFVGVGDSLAREVTNEYLQALGLPPAEKRMSKQSKPKKGKPAPRGVLVDGRWNYTADPVAFEHADKYVHDESLPFQSLDSVARHLLPTGRQHVVVLSYGLWEGFFFNVPPSAVHRGVVAGIHRFGEVLHNETLNATQAAEALNSTNGTTTLPPESSVPPRVASSGDAEPSPQPSSSPDQGRAPPGRLVMYVLHCMPERVHLQSPVSGQCWQGARGEGYRRAVACGVVRAVTNASNASTLPRVDVYDPCQRAVEGGDVFGSTRDGLHFRDAVLQTVAADIAARFGFGGCIGNASAGIAGVWSTEHLPDNAAVAESVRELFRCDEVFNDTSVRTPAALPTEGLGFEGLPATPATNWTHAVQMAPVRVQPVKASEKPSKASARKKPKVSAAVGTFEPQMWTVAMHDVENAPFAVPSDSALPPERRCPVHGTTADEALGWRPLAACTCNIMAQWKVGDACAATFEFVTRLANQRKVQGWDVALERLIRKMKNVRNGVTRVVAGACGVRAHKGCFAAQPTWLNLTALTPGAPAFEEAVLTACAWPAATGLCLLNHGARIGFDVGVLSAGSGAVRSALAQFAGLTVNQSYDVCNCGFHTVKAGRKIARSTSGPAAQNAEACTYLSTKLQPVLDLVAAVRREARSRMGPLGCDDGVLGAVDLCAKASPQQALSSLRGGSGAKLTMSFRGHPWRWAP